MLVLTKLYVIIYYELYMNTVNMGQLKSTLRRLGIIINKPYIILVLLLKKPQVVHY